MKDDRLVNRLALKLGMRLKKELILTVSKKVLCLKTTASLVSALSNGMPSMKILGKPILCFVRFLNRVLIIQTDYQIETLTNMLSYQSLQQSLGKP